MFYCPVCGYNGLDELPYINGDPSSGSFEICSCCGFQFGVDDLDGGYTHETYRKKWIDDGAVWFSNFTPAPNNWSLRKQLQNIGIYL